MAVTLTADQERMASSLVERGDFPDVGSVIDAAFANFLPLKPTEMDSEISALANGAGVDSIREQIDAGWRSVRAGRVEDGADVLSRIARKASGAG